MKEKKRRNESVPAGSQRPITWEGTATDPLGSYTGVAQDRMEVPVQDADDL